MDDLTNRICTPCQGGIPPLKDKELVPWMKRIHSGWKLTADETKIRREFTFPDFQATIAFVNAIADLAETEGHHPDLHIVYNKLTVELWTHKIHGLFDNDFIVAAKIDALHKHNK